MGDGGERLHEWMAGKPVAGTMSVTRLRYRVLKP